MKRHLGWIIGLAALVAGSSAFAQEANFPTKPIRIIVPFAPGASDAQIRIIAPIMQSKLGQPVLIENMGGGGGTIAANRVRAAAPDGYTLFFTGTAALTMLPALRSDITYTLDDFVSIGNVSSIVGIAVVSVDAPYKTMKELVAYAKANPRKINFGSAGVGTASHTFGVGPQAVGDFRFTHIPYRGMAEVMTGILSGTIDVGFGLPSLVMPHLQSGKMRAIAVTGANRSEFLPDVPTFKESGLNYVDGESYGLMGPKGVPAPVIERLTKALHDAMQTAEFRELMTKTFTTIQYLPPAEYQALLKGRDRQWRAYLTDPKFLELMKQ